MDLRRSALVRRLGKRLTRSGLAEPRREGIGVTDYLAEALKGSASFDPNAVRDVTLSQVQSLYGKRRPRRPSASAFGTNRVMGYADVLRWHYRNQGLSEAEVEAKVLSKLSSPGGNRHSASRK